MDKITKPQQKMIQLPLYSCTKTRPSFKVFLLFGLLLGGLINGLMLIMGTFNHPLGFFSTNVLIIGSTFVIYYYYHLWLPYHYTLIIAYDALYILQNDELVCSQKIQSLHYEQQTHPRSNLPSLKIWREDKKAVTIHFISTFKNKKIVPTLDTATNFIIYSKEDWTLLNQQLQSHFEMALNH